MLMILMKMKVKKMKTLLIREVADGKNEINIDNHLETKSKI